MWHALRGEPVTVFPVSSPPPYKHRPNQAPPQEFVLNTPTNEASKFWIGGAANTARISAIFAQARLRVAAAVH